MTLLAITTYGWIFIMLLILSLVLTAGVVKRMNAKGRDKGKGGCLNFGFVGLIIYILMIFVYTFSEAIFEKFYHALTNVFSPTNANAAHTLSIGEIALLFGASIMIFAMALVLIAVIKYAAGGSLSGITDFGLKFLMRFIFPFGMLFLLGGMGFALFQYFMGERPDMPLWAVIICCFFCLILILTIPAIIKMAYGKRNKIR
jgi:hypothetical protein